jgi:hypothetical protein
MLPHKYTKQSCNKLTWISCLTALDHSVNELTAVRFALANHANEQTLNRGPGPD